MYFNESFYCFESIKINKSIKETYLWARKSIMDHKSYNMSHDLWEFHSIKWRFVTCETPYIYFAWKMNYQRILLCLNIAYLTWILALLFYVGCKPIWAKIFGHDILVPSEPVFSPDFESTGQKFLWPQLTSELPF